MGEIAFIYWHELCIQRQETKNMLEGKVSAGLSKTVLQRTYLNLGEIHLQE